MCRIYERSLKERRQNSERNFNRYWNDPDYRLRMVNSTRARLGYELCKSVDEIKHRGPVSR